ncbi:DNA internalization-related competence protein ComEC/Rec2 [Roseateles koreensis]|uniref:DNA internalization-related competence protein ComEC/Rec2 n=1 Tax=Roseateles koreensis TaxID=2987526 RepID=A0ABT5KW10_9BURK|nr:DNA internalization-related competence protein ComEC/Rec2 [Roseateles koreensis]MDC8786987.1 DNA internalization-related competence protein ComEC/Rec2 [Roseateles koreensis]
MTVGRTPPSIPPSTPPARLHFSALHIAAPALACLVGLAVLQQLPALPGWCLTMVLSGLGGVLLLGSLLGLRKSPPGVWTHGLLLCLCLALGGLSFAQGAWRAHSRLDQSLPPAWEGRDVRVQGQVASLPTVLQGMTGAGGLRFEFEIDSAHDAQTGEDLSRWVPPHILLSWYVQAEEAPPKLMVGERWQLQLRLKQAHGLVNPFGFDAELWLFEQGVRATGTVRSQALPAPQRLAAAPWTSIDAWRQHLRDALYERVNQPAHAGILAALSLGDQAAISKDDWAVFRLTGVAHLLSVSGLHVTMFAWGMQGLVAWLWRRSGRACLVLPAVSAARWAGVMAAGAYALFSGWGVPAQRTVWMLASLALLRSLGVRWPWPLSLLLAAVIVTAIDPWALCQAGFWLSFMAVGLLMASGGGAQAPVPGWRGHIKAGLQSQWVATLGLAPLSLVFFQQISVVGLLANLIAIPLVSFVVAPLALAGALTPVLWVPADWAVSALMAYLHALAAWPWAVWSLAVAPVWAQLAGLLGGALCVMPLPWQLRLLGLPLALPLLWPAPWQPQAGEFEIMAADIGQGNAVLVRTAHHQLLFDTGPQLAPGIDAGDRVLLPLLHALGVNRLDVLMLSHRDSDHVGGAGSLMAGLPVEVLHSSLEPSNALLADAHRRGVHLRRCEQGQHWSWDGVQFELLHPRPAHYEQGLKSNAMSCVLHVRSASGASALLAGDLEAPQESALLAQLAAGQLRAPLRSQMLLVPHHGSKTSSSAAFLAAVAPQWAVVQAGYLNRFGHPAPSVLSRYQAQGIQVFDSPSCGAWQWRSQDPSPGLCQRALAPHYWQWQAPTRSTRFGPEPRVEEPVPPAGEWPGFEP